MTHNIDLPIRCDLSNYIYHSAKEAERKPQEECKYSVMYQLNISCILERYA